MFCVCIPVRDLRKKRRTTTSEFGEAEIPVTYGRWAKPKYLQEAKYDFLVVDATISANKDAKSSQTLGNYIYFVLAIIDPEKSFMLMKKFNSMCIKYSRQYI
jgi:hypothetical protein